MKGSPAVRLEGILCLSLAALCLAPVAALAADANAAPTVAITAPQEGLTIASRTVTIEAAFTAPDGATIAMAELAIDGVTVDAHKIDPPQAQGIVSFTWLARDYADGKHKIAVRAIDSDGRVAKAAISVVLKSSGSVRESAVRIVSPAEGGTVSGSTTVQVEVDNSALAKYVIFLVDDVLKAISNVRPFNYVWDTTRYLNGIHVLKAQAYSGGEWEAVSPPVQVHVDNPSGLTVMREPKAVPRHEGRDGGPSGLATATPVAPEPIAPPSRAGEPTLPPPVRSESPAPAYPEATLPTPQLAVPGTAPFVSPSGELITPPPPPPVQIAALPTFAEQSPTAPSSPIAPAKWAELPAPLSALPAPGAPSLAPAEPLVAAVPPAEVAASARREPAAAPIEIAMLAAPEITKASEPAPAAAIPAAPELVVAPAPAPEAPAMPEPAPAPAPAVALLPPAEHAADLSEVTQAQVGETRLIPAPQTSSAPVQIAMLPPKPVEAISAPMVAAEPMATQIAYVARTSMPLERLAVELGVPVAEIAKANNLGVESVVRVGQRLAIPSAPILFDGRPLALDAPAVVAAGRAIVPFRKVVEEAGGQVSWDSKQRRASASARGHEIAVTIGSDQAQVDGSAVAMGVVARIRCERTVVPARFLGDALDLALQYQDGIIHIASAR